MIKRKKILVEKEEVVDIFCDCCGKSAQTGWGFECVEITAHWGYMSKKDGQDWIAHICEKCVDEKLGFIKFIKTEYIHGALEE